MSARLHVYAFFLKFSPLTYKVHTTTDANSRSILDTRVTPGACHDAQGYLAHIVATVQNLKRLVTVVAA
jgi:hypothetical protein